MERFIEDVALLECAGCAGVFLPRRAMDELEKPERHGLRLAFPRRDRVPEPSIQYLKCPTCQKLMNRVNFGKAAGVVVDVCKDDGIWFDPGEVNAVIDFVEGGGLERAKARDVEERRAENERLKKQWRTLHEEAEAESFRRRSKVRVSPGERELLDRLGRFLFR